MTKYRAFGMQMAGGHTPSVNPIKRLYNGGSEWQDDIDGLADYYSTFFREYDAVIGRFNGVDPIAEVTDEVSTYAYSGNNPIMFNDPLGNNPQQGPSQNPEGYGPRMRDMVEKIMTSYGMGTDWYGLGGGSYGDFKARFDFLGSPAWKKEQNALMQRQYFTDLLIKWRADGKLPEEGDYWFQDGKGQHTIEHRIIIYGIIKDGRWQTNSVNDQVTESEWYEKKSKANWFFSTYGLGMEYLTGKTRVGNNLKLYLEREGGRVFNGNQHVITRALGKWGKFLGRLSFWTGFVLDLQGVSVWTQNPESSNAVHPTKFGVNTAMGIFGLKVNPLAGVLYFGIDAFYPGGWIGSKDGPGYFWDTDRNIQNNREIDPNWQLYLKDY